MPAGILQMVGETGVRRRANALLVIAEERQRLLELPNPMPVAEHAVPVPVGYLAAPARLP